MVVRTMRNDGKLVVPVPQPRSTFAVGSMLKSGAVPIRSVALTMYGMRTVNRLIARAESATTTPRRPRNHSWSSLPNSGRNPRSGEGRADGRAVADWRSDASMLLHLLIEADVEHGRGTRGRP